ncbi:fatty acid synthase-like isoform X1 [Euwallacea fornicatus]|uniref:fatty acid synthase-like isoform X1 n=1 Tax=Euwallacea fornicatus TaxID=995702 RepID=UPI00338FF5FC
MIPKEMELVKEDVVISGVGGYFPQSLNIEAFQNNLLENKNLVGTRWKQGERGVSNKVGTVPSEYFDNSYFGIHRQQCTFMDPMQRLILERTFEALIDAGVNPTEVKGRRIGVFMGSSIGENDNLFLESIISGFGVTGHSRAMMPNRVSYWLNLKGPSVAYDANWVSGLEVIRLGYEAIKTGQCESVIVGTSNLALNAEFQWLYADMGVLSPDGTTKAFDVDANGYTRSDGVVVLYLQKASEARRSYASIVNIATMFDGNHEGNIQNLSVPNMVEFMNKFYEGAPVKPEDVEFVEAYGCGHKPFDEKELDALDQVYCKNRKNPLLIGSVKTNTGHSEATSAMFSVAKVLIAMEQGIIPATIQYEKPNPKIPALVNGRLEVVTKNKEWNPTYAAVNGLGLDTYYGHLLLKANPKLKPHVTFDIPKLLVASTRTEDGISDIIKQYKDKSDDLEFVQLTQDLFAKPILGHLYRGYTLLGAEEQKQETEYHQGTKRPIWFVYSGMGSQWNAMLGDLQKIPVFAASIEKSRKILEAKGVDLLHIISSNDKTIFDNILNCFVGIAAMQIALTDVLRSIGLVPDGLIGHSVGELGCAYADGCMTHEQMILSSYSRGKASLEAVLIPGMMAAIGVGYNAIKNKLPPSIAVACHNGPDSATLSGPREDMEKFVAELQAQGVFARLVNVANIAYHSQYIKPAAPLLLKYLKEVLPKPIQRSSKWISTSNLEDKWNSDLAKHSSAEYHTNNLLSSVYFEEGLKHIPKDAILVEIAPHGLLQAILKRSLKTGCINIPLTHRGCKSGVEFLLTAMGKMYLAGTDISIANIYPKLEYPVGRGTRSLAPLVHWNHSEAWRTGLEEKLHSLFSITDMQVSLNSEEFREYVGHQLDDNVVLPVSFYLNLVYQLIANITTERKEIVFENVHFRKALIIPKIGSVPLHGMVQRGSGEFEISSGKEIIATGRMIFPQPTDQFMLKPSAVDDVDDGVELSGSDIYNEFQHRGHKYSGVYKAIKSLTLTENGSKGVVQWNNRWTTLLDAMIQQKLLQAGECDQDIFMAKTIQKICVDVKQFPKEKADVKVDYKYATKMIFTEGLQIMNVDAVPFDREPKKVFIDSLDYVPLNNKEYSQMEMGICVALQLVLTNFSDQYVNNVTVTEVASDRPLLEHITSALGQYTRLTANVTTAEDPKQVTVHKTHPFLIIHNGPINDKLAKIVSTSDAFLIVKTDKNILSNSTIVEVSDFLVNGQKYSILRKANNGDVIVVQAKGDVLSVKDLKRPSLPWVAELTNALDVASTTHKRVYLTSSLIPSEGFVQFVKQLKAQPNMDAVRVFFNLDKRSNVDLVQLYRKDLVLSILKGGVVNAYLQIAVKFKENITLDGFTNNVVEDKTIQYLGVNLRDETINPATEKPQELGLLDYSGTSRNQKIMGLATLNKTSSSLNLDPILQWPIPEAWSLEDGATVPYAYAAAYYALCVKGNIKSGNTVLIHAGCSPIGQAAISIANSYGCTIYVTVSTDKQRDYIKNRFKMIKDSQILSSENSNFEPFFLMATKGKGADVILNTLSGSLLQSSLGCIGDFGRFLHIGKYDLEENSTIGMYCFLRTVSFFVINLDIITESDDVKEEIRQLVEDGLFKKKCVSPIWRIVYNHQDVAEILRNIKKASNIGKALLKLETNARLNTLNMKRTNQFVCDPKGSYLVYGGTADQWIDVIEWLILRGACKIVISSESKPQQNHINRRLLLLQTYYPCEIIFTPNKAHTKEGASELISDVQFLGPVHAVFCLGQSKNSKTSDIKSVQYLEAALRASVPKALFINFIGAAAGTCQLRADAGYTTYNIERPDDLEFGDVLAGLDTILSYRVNNVFVNNDRVSDHKQENSQALLKKLYQMLPKSLDELSEQVEEAPEEPELIQLITEGPQEIRELIPLFIIPGLSTEKEIEELAKHLLLPTFCAVLPRKPFTLKELAKKYVELIRNVWSEGPFNIAGMSWSGVLATEIARILEKEYNSKVYLYLIDAAPATLQSAIQLFGMGAEFDVNLIAKVLNISDTQVLKKLQSAPTWEEKIDYVINSYEDKELLRDGLQLLRDRFQDVLTYKTDGSLINGLGHLIRPNDCSQYDNCELTLYLKQIPQVHLVNGDHLTIISSENTANYINETFQLT